MSQTIVNVEVLKTFLTPRGRQYAPKEPRRFELTVNEDEDIATLLETKVRSCFPKLQSQIQFMAKDAKSNIYILQNSKEILAAVSDTGSLVLFVQGESPKKFERGDGSKVLCSFCSSVVTILRTRCLQCDDHDLCLDCDTKRVHKGHVMIQSHRARFFNIGLVKFAGVLPALCHSIQESEPGSLRVTPEDVCTFWKQQRDEQIRIKKAERIEKQNKRKKNNNTLEANVDKQVATSPKMTGLRTRWDELLKGISKDEMEPSDGNVVKVQKVNELKPEWLTRCSAVLQQRMMMDMEITTLKANRSGNPQRDFLKLYMSQCWDIWHNLCKESGVKIGQQMRAQRQKEQRWINACIKIWIEEGKKMEQTIPITEEGAIEAEFPGFVPMMIKCWEIMMNQMQTDETVDSRSSKHVSTDAGMKQEEVGHAAAQTKLPMPKSSINHINKTWVNGCRDLWWRQVRLRSDNTNKSGDQPCQLTTQVELMKVMNDKHQIETYLTECHQLWLQFNRDVVHPSNEEKEEKGNKQRKRTSTNEQKSEIKSWARSLVPLWKERISQQIGKTKSDTVPKWDKQPFQGWRPFFRNHAAMLKGKPGVDYTEDAKLCDAKGKTCQGLKNWTKD